MTSLSSRLANLGLSPYQTDNLRRQIADALRAEAPAFARIARAALPPVVRTLLGSTVESVARYLVMRIADWIADVRSADLAAPDPVA